MAIHLYQQIVHGIVHGIIHNIVRVEINSVHKSLSWQPCDVHRILLLLTRIALLLMYESSLSMYADKGNAFI
jgi:hypothetical protein